MVWHWNHGTTERSRKVDLFEKYIKVRYHISMENILWYILHYSALIVGIVWVIIILTWITHCFIKFIKIEVKKWSKNQYNAIRAQLWTYLLLGLEFLIAADILETVFKPELSQLAILWSIVVIRTILNYFLTKELEHIEKEND